MQNAVTASMKQWLLEIRNVTATVGRAAMENMDTRARKWRTRREKDPMLRSSRVGSAVEMVTYERTDSKSVCTALTVVLRRHDAQIMSLTRTRLMSISNRYTNAFISIFL